jgi:hypothetical protein
MPPTPTGVKFCHCVRSRSIAKGKSEKFENFELEDPIKLNSLILLLAEATRMLTFGNRSGKTNYSAPCLLTLSYKRKHLLSSLRSCAKHQKWGRGVQSERRNVCILWDFRFPSHWLQKLLFFLSSVTFFGMGVCRMDKDSAMQSQISSAASLCSMQNTIASATFKRSGVMFLSRSSSLSLCLQTDTLHSSTKQKKSGISPRANYTDRHKVSGNFFG